MRHCFGTVKSLEDEMFDVVGLARFGLPIHDFRNKLLDKSVEADDVSRAIGEALYRVLEISGNFAAFSIPYSSSLRSCMNISHFCWYPRSPSL
jgi:hypothetical protein